MPLLTTYKKNLALYLSLFLSPIGTEKDFEGIIDLLEHKEIHWDENSKGASFETREIRPELQEITAQYYNNLIEQASSANCEAADTIANLFLEEKPVSKELIIDALRKGIKDALLLPVFCGSSLKNIGIQTLLDGIITYLPTPQEVPLVKVYKKEDDTTTLTPSTWAEDNRLMAVVFKSEVHSDYGLTHYVRVYKGTMKQASVVHDMNTGKKERVTRILHMHAHKSEQVDKLQEGEIGAIIGPRFSRTGHTLSDKPSPTILIEPITAPEPVITTSIEIENLSDRDKLIETLEKIIIEDPSFHYKEDEYTGQILISGMGELHLDVISTKVKDDYKVPVRQGKPQVNYRECIANTATETYNLKEHHVPMASEKNINIIMSMQVSPAERGKGIVFNNNIDATTQETHNISSTYISTIEQTVIESVSTGIILGYPIIDIVIDLSSIEIEGDASQDDILMLIKYTSAQAFHNACKNAKPIKMEPIMNVIISTSEEFVGEAMHTITSRNGIVHEVEKTEKIDLIKAEAPLQALFGYSTAIRNATQGRASFSMDFAYFSPVLVK